MNLPKGASPALHAASGRFVDHGDDEPYTVSDERLEEILGLLEPPENQNGWQVIPKPGVTVYDLAAAVEDLLVEREADRG